MFRNIIEQEVSFLFFKFSGENDSPSIQCSQGSKLATAIQQIRVKMYLLNKIIRVSCHWRVAEIRLHDYKRSALQLIS